MLYMKRTDAHKCTSFFFIMVLPLRITTSWLNHDVGMLMVLQQKILMLCLMVIYCTPCILHGCLLLCQAWQHYCKESCNHHDIPWQLWCSGQQYKKYTTIYNATTLKMEKAAPKMCGQVYGFSLYTQAGFEWNTKGNAKYLTCASHYATCHTSHTRNMWYQTEEPPKSMWKSV